MNPAPEFERRRARVYVAGPISLDAFEGVHRGIAMGRRMYLDGLAPYIPHFDAYFLLQDHEASWNAYLEWDLEYVAIADALYRLEGKSKGADLEVAHARAMRVPIFFEDTPGDYGRLLRYASRKKLRGKRR